MLFILTTLLIGIPLVAFAYAWILAGTGAARQLWRWLVGGLSLLILLRFGMVAVGVRPTSLWGGLMLFIISWSLTVWCVLVGHEMQTQSRATIRAGAPGARIGARMGAMGGAIAGMYLTILVANLLPLHKHGITQRDVVVLSVVVGVALGAIGRQIGIAFLDRHTDGPDSH